MSVTTRSAVRSRLTAFIRSLDIETPGPFGDDIPLIDSGILDSLSILQLAQWIEAEVGHPLDPTHIQLPADWNTTERILDFVTRNRNDGNTTSA